MNFFRLPLCQHRLSFDGVYSSRESIQSYLHSFNVKEPDMKLTVPVFVFVISCAALFPSLISTSFSQQLFHFESQQKARETQQSNFGNTPRVDDVPLQARQLYRDKPYKKPYSTSSVNFVVVDSMTNIFSMGSSQINPLYYDPTIDRLTFVHRGDATSYAASSGAIYYNYSSDGGSSWTRNSGALNGADSPISGRYPSGVIFSPTSNVADARFFSSYSNLYFNGSANVFGDFGVGWDSPAFSNNANSYRHAHDVSNNFSYEFETQCWSSDLNMYYTDVRRQGLTGNGPFIGLNIFKSANFASMPIAATPLGLSTPTCFNIYKILGGDFMKTSATNRSAVAAIASYLGSPPMLEVIYTVDEGNTWDGGWAGGGVDIVSPASIPELCPYKYFWMRYSNNYFSCSGDMVLDSLGYPHCLVGLQAEPQNSAGVDVVIAEIYRDASGWHGKIISHGDPQTHFVAGTLDGNGYAPYISRDASGRSFAVQYTSSDNVNENADLFLSTRYWSSWADWSSPVNITQTPSFNENVAHFSPRMRDDGSTMFTVWSAFAQPKDSTIVADAAVN